MRNTNIQIWLSRIGLGMILIYGVLASIFFAYFAQLHVKFNFLPFPIFIGEIMLLICLLLFAAICRGGQLFSRPTMLLLSLYFGWVLIKAAINYHYDGPLTCRNAALFYYPIVAVFAYSFYQKAKIPRHVLMMLALGAAGIVFFKLMTAWCWWTYFTLLVIAIWNIQSIKLRWVGWVFLGAIILLGKEYIYQGPRANFVSVFGAVLFLVIYFGAFLAKRRDFVKLGILLTVVVFFMLGFLVVSSRNDISSLTSLKGIINTYKAFDSEYKEKEAAFVSPKLSVQLYNHKKFAELFTPSPSVYDAPPDPGSAVAVPTISNPSTPSISPTTVPIVSSTPHKEKSMFLACWVKNIFGNILGSRIRDGRSLELNENNIIFRLFVWRDMVYELIKQRAWWGFSFGHPQRSRSLEVLGWAETEWGRDGWITPHNSFFHIIYRAGILGILFIVILFWMLARLIKDFFRMDSVEGGILVSGLIYWMVLSNFFVILEFPYNAIIFWTLFGITVAYHNELKKNFQERGIAV